jgi:hypothetical protein
VISVKYVLGAVLGGLAAAVAANLPDVKRYLRMRSM